VPLRFFATMWGMDRESFIITIFASRKLIQWGSLCSFLSFGPFYPFLFFLFSTFDFSRCFHSSFRLNSPILTFLILQREIPSWLKPTTDLAFTNSWSNWRLFFQQLSLNIIVFLRFICNNTKKYSSLWRLSISSSMRIGKYVSRMFLHALSNTMKQSSLWFWLKNFAAFSCKFGSLAVQAKLASLYYELLIKVNIFFICSLFYKFSPDDFFWSFVLKLLRNYIL
jgi:hypothetical protein